VLHEVSQGKLPIFSHSTGRRGVGELVCPGELRALLNPNPGGLAELLALLNLGGLAELLARLNPGGLAGLSS
jgi:hypothetical protein